MEGQWLGTSGAQTSFSIFLNIDEESNHYRGTAHLYNQIPDEPDLVASFQTKDKRQNQTLQLYFEAVDPRAHAVIPKERLQEFYPDFVIPTPVQIGFVAQQRSLKVSWLAQDGSNQNCNLLKSKANQPSNYKGGKRFRSWSAFREFAVGLEPHRFIFRGQPHPYRLRTGFHRTKRKDMLRFLEEDMPHLHRLINAQTTHYFDFQDRLRTGAFWNLIQHHGYPTPLLDWTHSPFVAAYFAYRSTFKSVKPNQKVRIFMFDRKEWQNDLPQFDSIAFTRPHLSILETIAIENNRAISQQALFTVSSVDDIEGHIAQLEKLANKRYLQVFDLPAVDRENVMRELSLMGITARTMFPGLDGACEELRERFF